MRIIHVINGTIQQRRSRLHEFGIRIARRSKGQPQNNGWYAVRRDIDEPSDYRERRGPYPDVATAVTRGEQLMEHPPAVSRHLDKTESGFRHNSKSRNAEKTPTCTAYQRAVLLTDEITDEPPLHSTLLKM